MKFIFDTYELMPFYILVFTRITTLLLAMPIFSYTVINSQLRVMLSLVLTVIISPMIPVNIPQFSSLVMLFAGIAREIMIGLSIGFGAKVLFEGFSLAGSIASRQMGLMMANTMDPTSHQQVPIISQFWILLLITFFVVSNGHYIFIETLFTNFKLIPIGGGVFNGKIGEIMVRNGSEAFVIGIKFAAPAMALLLVTDTAIALMARVMPQMNIFIVSLPLKIGVGIYALIASLNIFQVMFNSFYTQINQYMNSIMYQLGG